MKSHAPFLTAALGAAFLLPAAAIAEPQCNTRDSVISQLAEKYQEAPVAVGVTHSGGLIEVLTADKGATWSIIITSPQGMSCLVVVGENWRSIEHLVQDPEA